ncbi:hypothetical protein [Sphingomonas sp.]|uniref:hypothetical protein n=1 Tax=Sphingomonas sp. TaxID=28214 RepID=UPI0031E48C9E
MLPPVASLTRGELYRARFEDGKLAESRTLGEADAAMLTRQRRRMIADPGRNQQEDLDACP